MFHRLWRWRELKAKLHWHPETFVCSRRGHVLPAARVAHLRPQDAGVGIDLPDGRRFARCIRCDSWRDVPIPSNPESDYLPPISQIELPRRGDALREALVLRVIAIDRIIHVILFGLLFAFGLLVRLNIGPLHTQAQAIIRSLQGTAQNTSSGFIITEIHHIVRVSSGAIDVLIWTSAAYFVLELVEAIGLWHEKRWAEYLTVVATAGLMPFEILSLIDRITLIRVGAFLINLAIVIWLAWRKRLFGLNGGRQAPHEILEPGSVLAPPSAKGREAEPVS
jgi:uncharacterized membrane protein (DUF2068 family)